MARKYKYPLVEVIWDDAEGDTGWEEIPEKDLEPKLATTVAFLIKETKDHVLLASSYDDVMTNNRIQIPRAIVVGMKKIR